MAEINPFALIQQGVENSNQLFGSMQRSLLQQRQLQLQEQSQVFQQGIQLKTLDLKEKEMNLDARVSMAKLGMANQQLGMDAALQAQRIETEKAHANLYNAQAFKAQQLKTVAPYYDIDLNGPTDQIIGQTRAMRGAAQRTMDPVMDSVLNEVATTPPEAPAYQMPNLRTNLGSTALGVGSGMAVSTAADEEGNLFADSPTTASPRQGALNGPPTNGAGPAPKKSAFAEFNDELKYLEAQTAVMDDWTDSQRKARIQQIHRTRLDRAQNEYADDPEAKRLLSQQSSATAYIREMAAQGRMSDARAEADNYRNEYGTENPNYLQAIREGAEEFQRTAQSAKLWDQYEKLVARKASLESQEAEVPALIQDQLKALSAQLAIGVGVASDKSKLEEYKAAGRQAVSPYYSPASTFP